jgi:hypothetical protein
MVRAEQAGGGGVAYNLVLESAMSRQPPSWRTANGQTAWLSRLIEAMEEFSRPEWRGVPLDRFELAATCAHLAQPAMAHAARAARFDLRN